MVEQNSKQKLSTAPLLFANFLRYMARLVGQSDGVRDRVIELHLGVNRFGRSPDNDFQIQHASVSALHCEVILAGDEVIVRDCDSTNGTFLGGEQITQAILHTGQSLCLGEVE